jgi:signal transduction histidine kinase
VSAEERAEIGHIPEGRGLLGVILREGAVLRLNDITADPRSYGFPPHHPRMKSLLGAPVIVGSRIVGNLYLSEKRGDVPFDARDEEMVRLLAAQAAAAVQNADLHERLESVARLEERERIGMDLHDGVIQSIYAVGLRLEDIGDTLPAEAVSSREQVEQSIEDLSRVIRDIRSYIFDLRPQVSEVRDLPEAVSQLAAHCRVNTLMNVNVDIDGYTGGVETAAAALALFHIAQEALNNIVKHAHAQNVSVVLATREDQVVLEVADDGVGFGQDTPAEGHGLRNIRDRARSIGADVTWSSAPGGGTIVRANLPREGT